MKIESISRKGNFKLIKNNEEICELIYDNWFSEKAKTLLNGNKIEIKPKNIWTSRVDIFKNENRIGDITFNLQGHMVLRLKKPTGEEYNYLLKNKAQWKLRFEVFNGSEVPQLILKSSTAWTKLNYNYDIEITEYDSEFEIEELVVYCAYAVNLYLAIIGAA